MSLLEQLLTERFPTPDQIEAELGKPVPEYHWPDRRPYRAGREGMTRFEILLQQARRVEAS